MSQPVSASLPTVSYGWPSSSGADLERQAVSTPLWHPQGNVWRKSERTTTGEHNVLFIYLFILFYFIAVSFSSS